MRAPSQNKKPRSIFVETIPRGPILADVNSLGKAFKLALPGHRGIYFLSFVLQFFMTVLTVFTTFLTKVLLDTLSGDLEKAEFIESWVIDALSLGKGPQFLYDNIYVLPIAIIVFALVTAVVSLLRFRCRVRAGNDLAKQMRLKLFHHMERLPYRHFKTEKSGDLIQTCTRDIDLARQFMTMDLSQITYTIFVVVLCFSILLEISWKLTVVSVILLPFMFIYSFFLIKEVRRRFRVSDDAEAAMVEKINQNLNGVRVVKAYNAESKEIASFEESLSYYSRVFRREKRLSAFFFGSTDIFIFASRSIAIIFSIYLVFKGEITPGTVFVAYTFVNMMVWPLRNTATTLSRLGQTLAATDRIDKLMSKPIEELEEGLTPKIEGKVEFKDVSFAYPDDPDHNIIEGISLTIEKGQTVALMGKTGSGKSSLSQLLTRLYEPASGAIYIDGTPIAEMSLSHLRRNVVPVLQDPFLFSKTVYENIGITAADPSEKDIIEAARIASVDDAIASFAQGYDTPVGEKGVTLSGGQKQRVAIARTVLTKAPILIFDDSLSAVDAKTDLAIRSHLKALGESSTIIIVTHRVSTAKDADKIVVMDEGRIVEMGNDEELRKKKGLYARIADIQSVIAA